MQMLMFTKATVMERRAAQSRIGGGGGNDSINSTVIADGNNNYRNADTLRWQIGYHF